MAVNHYESLRVREDASSDEVDEAARRAISAVRDNPSLGAEKLASIRAAIEVLRDPIKRAEYDASLRDRVSHSMRASTIPAALNQNAPLRTKQFAALALMIGLLAGYFIGREHVKYQLQSAMSEALGSFASNLGKAFGGGAASPERKAPPKVSAFPIKVTLVSKGFEQGDFRSKLTLSFSFMNSTGKNVRAFDGRVVFTDLLGNEIMGVKVAVNDPVAAGQSIAWEGAVDYNQFMSTHQEMRNADQKNIKTQFVLSKVLFEDGEGKEY